MINMNELKKGDVVRGVHYSTRYSKEGIEYFKTIRSIDKENGCFDIRFKDNTSWNYDKEGEAHSSFLIDKILEVL